MCMYIYVDIYIWKHRSIDEEACLFFNLHLRCNALLSELLGAVRAFDWGLDFFCGPSEAIFGHGPSLGGAGRSYLPTFGV